MTVGELSLTYLACRVLLQDMLIPDDVFINTMKGLTIYAPSGPHLESYANRFRYNYLAWTLDTYFEYDNTPDNYINIKGLKAKGGGNSLTQIVVPMYIEDRKVVSIGEGAFKSAYNIKTMILPSSIVTIGEKAFEGCYNLTNINLPYSVRHIESLAFSFCSALTEVVFFKDVQSIQADVFKEASQYINVFGPLSGTIANYCSDNGIPYNEGTQSNCFDYTSTRNANGDLVIRINGLKAHYCVLGHSHISIPAYIKGLQVEKIAAGAFKGKSEITSIKIPFGVNEIGIGVFNGCNNLRSLVIDEANQYFYFDNNAIVMNGNILHTYVPVVEMSSYSISDNIKVIAEKAFAGNNTLTSIALPNLLETIGIGAFSNCTKLTTIVPGANFRFEKGALYTSDMVQLIAHSRR